MRRKETEKSRTRIREVRDPHSSCQLSQDPGAVATTTKVVPQAPNRADRHGVIFVRRVTWHKELDRPILDRNLPLVFQKGGHYVQITPAGDETATSHKHIVNPGTQD